MRNMRTLIFVLTISISSVQAQDAKFTEVWRPEPRTVLPGKSPSDAPADAIVLLNGNDLSQWENVSDKKTIKWRSGDNAMTVIKGGGNIQTKQSFGDCQLHIEWRTPAEVKASGQNRGNSGIFFMSRYELQVLDSYGNRTYSNGQAGSIYKQHIPLVNASKAPGEWQTYDVIFTAPRFNADSSVKSPARITVFQNGILVQNNVEIIGSTSNVGIAHYIPHPEKLPLMLQDHGDEVSFRNVWVREL
ncbi:MAG: DUF1080 domain-containing protein [Chitinophagaceae bacterium]|nr:DUF1080 domain-containing protein [Chitinophagaceae bacterium]